MSSEDDKPPTSKEEAAARCVRPPPEKYDPDVLPYWSITMTLAWIIWRDLDAVRIERDDYRSECADWKPEKTLAERLAEKIASNNKTGLARRYPDVQKKLQEKLKEQKLEKEPSWHRRHWPPSSWNELCLRAISEAVLEPRQQAILSPQDARVELWQAAEEGGIIKATALEYESVKAYADDPNAGNPVEIPAIHWKYLKFDPSGKPILLGPGGRVYRDVQFRRLGVKEQWPPLSVEPLEPGAVEVLPEPERVETPEPARPAEPETLKPKLPRPAVSRQPAKKKPKGKKAAGGAKESGVWVEIVAYLKAKFPDKPYPLSHVSFNAAKDWLLDNKKAMLAESTIRVGLKRHFPKWPRNSNRR